MFTASTHSLEPLTKYKAWNFVFKGHWYRLWRCSLFHVTFGICCRREVHPAWAVQDSRSVKTSKKSSSHRHVGSRVLCQEIWPSMHKTAWDVPGTHRSDALCHHCHAHPHEGEWCSVQISTECHALQQAWILHRLNAGKGRAEQGTSLGSSRVS